MPTITRPDGSVVTRAADAERLVRSLGLGVAKAAPAASLALGRVMAGRRLTDEDSRQILAANRHLLPAGHVGADVFALFPETPGLGTLRFHRCHTHADDEVRFILAGEGVFGFVLPGGGQIEITAEAGDLLRVPAGIEHWFRLGPRRTVVAVRLFGANPDWRADYTGTEILFPTA